MTTTNTYNPIFRAFRELTTPQAFRWYGTQAKATATLAKAIAHYSFTNAQRLLSDSKPAAIAPAIAESENAPTRQDDSDAVVGLENAMLTLQESASQQEYAPVIDEPENAMLTLQESALQQDILAEVAEVRDLPVPDGWEAIEAEDLMQVQPEPALDNSENDCISIDEPEQAITTHQEYASAELQQEYARSETIAPDPDLGDAIAGDGETEAAFSWVDDAQLDNEDDTELRPWAREDEAEEDA